ncbi:MAG: hypothetical protein R3C11_04970 [Planctomycetaceae bacterium]
MNVNYLVGWAFSIVPRRICPSLLMLLFWKKLPNRESQRQSPLG